MSEQGYEAMDLPVPPEWESGDCLRRITPENGSLDAAILAALYLKEPQAQLSRYEREAQQTDRQLEVLFWRRAQELFVRIMTPTENSDTLDKRPTWH
ncbi:hypothetical protein HBA54_17795 [Pelagibius litoralis]|uniref:Uncharacterized protein n=1 Tax=Pelagibius litoralis TaxID=374515 RepID=A0A967KBN1_9PROT|nr:hypothetical protein [Pelagibius litoralis]NIA70454.1 hypothetical protein [Pelagibius litoralis]